MTTSEAMVVVVVFSLLAVRIFISNQKRLYVALRIEKMKIC
jgi:hypothetical protein